MAEGEFNVTEHIFVPLHSITDAKEEEALLVRFNISKKQMPKIKIDDPAIQQLNPKVGDIIKVIRKSPVDVRSTFYRVVVDE